MASEIMQLSKHYFPVDCLSLSYINYSWSSINYRDTLYKPCIVSMQILVLVTERFCCTLKWESIKILKLQIGMCSFLFTFSIFGGFKGEHLASGQVSRMIDTAVYSPLTPPPFTLRFLSLLLLLFGLHILCRLFI